eukprot:CAMPEP_0184664258 /NCGR_PEP_ID=MMETSP0308-20130426/51899_1 /TAXON_ID=38269 /ORGANISM="Gloeochaete witrockiana, Strain SAG 46.84" /LENGTH=353 /DNA_ID=CAMNT_0027107517 /DNA_START=214 /DNA_END=1275 /DNA_ORIENTATION=+
MAVSGRWANASTLIESIRNAGRRLVQAQPLELSVGNVVRRVLYIIREEYLTAQLQQSQHIARPDGGGGAAAQSPLSQDSSKHSSSLGKDKNLLLLEHVLSRVPVHRSGSLRYLMEEAALGQLDFTQTLPNLRGQIIEAINEMIDDITNIYHHIADIALEHIHTNEVILTYGSSRTVAAFLLAAAKKKRTFEVIVAETAPYYRGHETAMRLATEGIQTTVIPDCDVFAMMARVNKVIVGVHAVMANGGLLMASGGHVIASAAKYHSVPLVAVTGLYKLSPLYPHDLDALNDLASPAHVLNFHEEYAEDVHVLNPVFDYVPPDLVSLFITNLGGNNPSYIYRLLAEFYSPEDYDL